MKGINNFFAAFFVLPITLLSCGLDTVVYLEPVKRENDNYNSDQAVNAYVSLRTSEAYPSANNTAGDLFKGVEIYYKIYERESERYSDYSSIDKYNEDNPAVSAKYLLETKKYHKLSASGSSFGENPLIKKTGTDRIIKIRLVNFGDSEERGIYINNTKEGIPKRINNLKFEAEDIEKTHEDVIKSSSENDSGENWLINFYAASYGNDDGFRPIYSKLEFLGYLKIKKEN